MNWGWARNQVVSVRSVEETVGEHSKHVWDFCETHGKWLWGICELCVWYQEGLRSW